MATSAGVEPNALIIERARTSVVRFNRPGNGNGLSPTIALEIASVVRDLGNDPEARAIVFIGSGEVFCSGGDLADILRIFESRDYQNYITYMETIWMPAIQRAFWEIWQSPLVTVAAINGTASGGGLDLTLCCDYRVAAASSRFSESYANVGQIPVGGGSVLLPARAGSGIARKMLMSGEEVDSATALRAGFIDEVVEADELLARSHVVAASMSSAPRATVEQLKIILRGRDSQALAETFELSRRGNALLLADPEIRALSEKLLRGFGL